MTTRRLLVIMVGAIIALVTARGGGSHRAQSRPTGDGDGNA